MEKYRHKVTVDEETEAYIQEYMKEHKLRFASEAIIDICEKYRKIQEQEWSLKYISEVVSNSLHDVIKEELTRIRLGTNSADKNTQILIEYMNGLFFHHGFDGLMTTELQELDSTKVAKETVEKRIAHQRQKKVDAEESRGKQPSH
ncbi:hypothetical protein COJ70_24430 [Priestia megaterium]|uniref:Uncharacterized protein n=1 Tax=Priestia megaterium TaxID=1404 RepID=A0AAE5U9Z3_PRIMG|nr:hypothetical protein [Priestia megaterium]MCT9853337.1 hypothetical protein [Priestia megaterium]MDF1964648.1 hypothetical protein [Priestia megaterium]PES30481.1 hypothetical protein CN497_24105 [Priestia megaterium]PFO12718.1 hypothetical protein COJ70_24430 [Priestia megaterium]UKJ83697.1 hypothetical protein H1W83_29360 [Priestia megaterium]